MYKTTKISKQTKDCKGRIYNDFWTFRLSEFADGTVERVAIRKTVNERGTWSKILAIKSFDTREEGNEFYKRLIAEGYAK